MRLAEHALETLPPDRRDLRTIGLAIPAEVAEPIVRQLIAGEAIERGFLGVQIQPVDEDIADALGIERNRGELVQGVQPGEAADDAGLRAGDVVISVNGEDVTPDNTLSFIVANIAPGTQVPLVYIRDGERRRTNVTVGRRPSAEELARQQMFQDEEDEQGAMTPEGSSSLVQDALGIQAIPIDATIARQLGVATDTRGLAITAVAPGTDAERRGLARGVLILSANGRPVPTLEALEQVIAEARAAGRGAILLRVQARRGQPQSVPVRLIAE